MQCDRHRESERGVSRGESQRLEWNDRAVQHNRRERATVNDAIASVATSRLARPTRARSEARGTVVTRTPARTVESMRFDHPLGTIEHPRCHHRSLPSQGSLAVGRPKRIIAHPRAGRQDHIAQLESWSQRGNDRLTHRDERRCCENRRTTAPHRASANRRASCLCTLILHTPAFAACPFVRRCVAHATAAAATCRPEDAESAVDRSTDAEQAGESIACCRYRSAVRS